MYLFRSLLLVLILVMISQSLKGSSHFDEPINLLDQPNSFVLLNSSPSFEPRQVPPKLIF